MFNVNAIVDVDVNRDWEKILSYVQQKYYAKSMAYNWPEVFDYWVEKETTPFDLFKSDEVAFRTAKGESVREKEYILPYISAPISAGEAVGYIEYYCGQNLVAKQTLTAGEAVNALPQTDFIDLFLIKKKENSALITVEADKKIIYFIIKRLKKARALEIYFTSSAN